MSNAGQKEKQRTKPLFSQKKEKARRIAVFGITSPIDFRRRKSTDFSIPTAESRDQRAILLDAKKKRRGRKKKRDRYRGKKNSHSEYRRVLLPLRGERHRRNSDSSKRRE